MRQKREITRSISTDFCASPIISEVIQNHIVIDKDVITTIQGGIDYDY